MFYDLVIEDFGAVTGVKEYVVKDSVDCFSAEKIAYHGRYYSDRQSGAVWISYTNAGFEVTFYGTTLEGDFLATRADDNKSKPYIAVCVDNDYDPDHATPIAFTSYGKYRNGSNIGGGISRHERVVLAHGLEEGEHTVRIYKRSECQNSRLALVSVACDGRILPVSARQFGLKLEFFGDSVTCGYAVESEDYYENFTTRTENGMKTYANYCANLLNADLSCVSAGGYPLYKSIYSEYNHPSDVPSMLSMAEFEYQTSFEHPWDNWLFVPDAVVIALGANDGSVLSRFTTDEQYAEFFNGFERAYYDFIQRLYAVYPQTLIVVSDEVIQIDGRFSAIADQVVETLRQQGKKIIRVKHNASELAVDKTMPGAGHPNAEMQLIAGHQLADALAEYFSIRLDDSDFWAQYGL